MNKAVYTTFTLPIFAPLAAHAATGATCVSVTDSSVGNAAGAAVLVMFGVMAFVFGILGGFMYTLARRAKLATGKPMPRPITP